jgi:hypothetical protein
MLKLATINDIDTIMEIINDAKNYLKDQGSLQWNLPDGYPNKNNLLDDIKNASCYLYIENNNVIGTMSIIYTPDENYMEIDGRWLTNTPYASIHRIAVKNNSHNKNIGVKMLFEAEEIVKSKNIFSIKIDTHKINIPMTKTIIKAGYSYCGIIKLKRCNVDNLRDAYEKRLTQKS